MINIREGEEALKDEALLQTIRFSYLYAEEYSFPSTWNYYETNIPYGMIRYIRSGQAVFVINGNRYELEAGDIIYIPQGCTLSCESRSTKLVFISIRFTAVIPATNVEMWSEIIGYEIKVKCHQQYVQHYFEEIMQNRYAESRGRPLILRGYLELIIAYLINQVNEEERVRQKTAMITNDYKKDNRAQYIVDYMIQNYNKELTIEHLSQIVNVSPATLRRLFKQHTGKAPSEFLMDIRLKIAARKLLETDDRVSDISYMIGIEDPNYFARIFKKNFGVSPYAYRSYIKGV